MAKARRRAPGGGRKPKEPEVGKRASFNTRITHEVRRMMEEIARTSPGLKTVSAVAEKWLQEGYERTVSATRTSHTSKRYSV